MIDAARTTRFRFWLWLIRAIGVVVPRRLRAEWRQEWEAELRSREAMLAEWERLDWPNKLELLWRSLGAFADALWLQQLRWEDDMIQDLRFGVRMLLRQPVFTAVAILTLALGVGANTAIFSVVNGVLLRPLPYAEPGRLIRVFDSADGGRTWGLTEAEFLEFEAQNQVFENLAIYVTGTMNLTGRGEAERVTGAWSSAGLLTTLRARPMLGRGFTTDEEQEGHNQVVLLSHGLWQRRFGGDAGVIGQQIKLHGLTHTVVGVMPPGFGFPNQAVEMWAPLIVNRAAPADERDYQMVGRLKPGVTIEQARAGMETIAGRIRQEFPRRYPKFTNILPGVSLVPLLDAQVGEVRRALLVLLGAVGFVLLIACANVANLMLARAEVRQREVAVRAALGAGRLRLVRQMLTESLMLALAGGGLGLMLAFVGVKVLLKIAPANLPRAGEVAVDGYVLGFSLLITILTGLIFGLVPAWQASRPDLNATLKEGGRTGGAGRRRGRSLLVVSEVALALVLTLGAGLLVRSFRWLLHVDPGFNPQHVLTVNVMPPQPLYPTQQKVEAFYNRLLDRVSALPGVQAVGAVTHLPLATHDDSMTFFQKEGSSGKVGADGQNAYVRIATQDYFQTLGIPLRRGRGFEAQDTERTPPVIVINETMARRFWPDTDAVGKRIRRGEDQPWLTIIGIVGDVRFDGLHAPAKQEMYFARTQTAYSNGQWVWPPMTLVVRAAGDPAGLAPAVRNEVRLIDPDVTLTQVQTMEQVLAASLAQSRFALLLLTLFAAVALVLAAGGIYGVLAYVVAQRTHEIGVRMALGAEARDVLRLVVGHGLRLALGGIAIGLIGGLALTRVLASQLYGVSATDPLTFVSVALLLGGVALAASFLPARRAARVDPLVALRHE